MRFHSSWFVVLLCGVVALGFCGCQRQDATATESLKKPVGLPPCCAGKAAAGSTGAAQAEDQQLPADANNPAADRVETGGETASLDGMPGVLHQAECCDGENCPTKGTGATDAPPCCPKDAADGATASEPGPAEGGGVDAVMADGANGEAGKANAAAPADEKKSDEAASKATKLFDGKTLKGWKKTAFGGEGEVKVEDGMIVMEIGNDMTGVTWDGQPPATDNYELTLRAQRLDGDDFFCAATFPIGKEHCTLVLGGWGGTLVGISCVDGYDASDNTTTRTMTFKNKQWYDVRIRVSTKKLEAWIDGEQVVNLPRGDHKFSTRFECDPCRPLGFATWRTKGAVKDVEFRKLTADEVAEISEDE